MTCVALAPTGVPAWANDIALPATAVTMPATGEDAPQDLVLLQPTQPTVLKVQGPAELQLVFYGLVKGPKPKRNPRPGSVAVRVDGQPAQPVALSGDPVPRWHLTKRPLFSATEPTRLTLSLHEGEHTLLIKPHPAVKLGYLLGIEFAHPNTTVAQMPPAPDPEARAPDEGQSAAVSADADPLEPELVLPASVEDEVPLAEAPAVALEAPERPGVRVLGQPPQTLDITGARAAETFYWLGLDDALALEAVGPGTLFVDFHAHREPARPETYEPVVIALFLNDVLAQTLVLNQKDSTEYTPRAPFRLSQRATLRLPLPSGVHRVRFTVSDTAVLGVAARPRFEEPGAPEAPQVLTAEAARENDLVARSYERDGGWLLRASVGGLLQHATGAQGAFAELAVGLGVPFGAHLMAVELIGGYGQSHGTVTPPDGRTDSAAALTIDTVPLMLGLSWEAPLPAPWHFGVGVGGGALVTRVAMRVKDAQVTSPFLPALGGLGYVQAGVDLGGGVLSLRTQAMTGQPVDAGALRNADPGGVAVLVGYGLGTQRAD